MENTLKLPRNDFQTQTLLLEGQIEHQSKKWVAIAERIEGPAVVFRLHDPKTHSVPSFVFRLFKSIRAISLTATLTPGVLVALSGSWVLGLNLDWVSFLCAWFAVAFLQIAVNVLNDVSDHLRLIDLPGQIGSSGVIQQGWLSARFLRNFAYFSGAIAIGLGLIALLAHPGSIGLVVAVAALLALQYSNGPFPMKYKALGDLLVYFTCGPLLTLGFSWVSFESSSALFLWLGHLLGLGAVAILHANNLNDLEIDRDRGAKTLASVLGFEGSKRFFVAVQVLFWISVLVAVAIGHLPLVAAAPLLLVLPLSLKKIKTVMAATQPLDPTLATIRFEMAQLHLMTGVLLCIGILVQRFIF